MLQIRRAAERGQFQNDWLHSQHSFSFGEYHDPAHMGISVLRVINEDRVAAQAGFPTHAHHNMEIMTYVLTGQLAHQDSLGNGSVISAGDVQRMSAGSGIRHSEFNPSPTQPTHFLQIWLLPTQRNITPSYAQRHFSTEDKLNRWCLLLSPEGAEQSLTANTTARVYASCLDAHQRLALYLDANRQAYLFLANGALQIGTQHLASGDAVEVPPGSALELYAQEASEVLLFELPSV